MPTYVVLGTLTDQGRRRVQEFPQRRDATRKVLTRLGGTVVAFFYTMGPHDYVSIVAVKDDETLAKFLLAITAGGNIRPTTLRAFSEGEYRLLVEGRGEPRRETQTERIVPKGRTPMPTYLALGTFTDQGRRTIQESPKRLDAVKKALVAIGGRLEAFYLTMGPYDFVAVIEAPNDETVAKYALAVSAQGAVRIVVCRAFPEAEYRRLIKG